MKEYGVTHEPTDRVYPWLLMVKWNVPGIYDVKSSTVARFKSKELAEAVLLRSGVL